MILADTKFEFGVDDAGVLTLGDEVCTPDSSRFWPADSYEVGSRASRRSTSSTCATGRRTAAGTRTRRRRRSRTTWSRRPASATSTAYERLPGEPFGAWLDRVRHDARPRVLIRPKAGILDPQGQAVERALPALGFEGVAHVHVGRLVELDVEDPSQVAAMCENLLANPLIEDYEIQS